MPATEGGHGYIINKFFFFKWLYYMCKCPYYFMLILLCRFLSQSGPDV